MQYLSKNLSLMSIFVLKWQYRNFQAKRENIGNVLETLSLGAD